jgi:hypothetical protein
MEIQGTAVFMNNDNHGGCFTSNAGSGQCRTADGAILSFTPTQIGVKLSDGTSVTGPRVPLSATKWFAAWTAYDLNATIEIEVFSLCSK